MRSLAPIILHHNGIPHYDIRHLLLPSLSPFCQMLVSCHSQVAQIQFPGDVLTDFGDRWGLPFSK